MPKYNLRKIHINCITEEVKRLCIDTNYYLNEDVLNSLKTGYNSEESKIGKGIIDDIIKNANIAKEKNMAICQDTGMVVIFMKIGQDVRITGGSLEEAINEGVRQGYSEGYLRSSVVSDPINRINTGDNTPAVIHYEIVKGDKIEIELTPKGFGSENMSALKMLKPSDGVEGIKQFIIEVVEKAGPNSCPPFIVGIGIGGTMEKAALLSKKALLRPINTSNSNETYKNLELELLNKINSLGIGPQGLGGRITALGVNIEYYPTHIAGLPVAVNMSCHVTRHGKVLM